MYSRYYEKIHDKQEQLKYFNNLIDDSRDSGKKVPLISDKSH